MALYLGSWIAKRKGLFPRVMAGQKREAGLRSNLPAIHVLPFYCVQDVDARDILSKTRSALLPGHDELLHSFLYATASKHQAKMPFCAWRRFSASSNTTDCGPSITSSVTSSPRWAGRQCMKIASGLASDISLALT